MGSLTGPGLGKFVCSDLATCSLSDLGTADASDITSGTFGLARIPDLPTTKITSGTFNANRIPILPISRYGSAVLVDGSRSMEGTFSMGTHEIDHLKKVMFREEHDVALITEGTYLVSLTNKAESVWGNQSLGWLYVYGGVDMNGHPLTEVAAPTQGSHAANKNYIDNHIWEANDITTGTFSEDRIPNLPTTKITSGTFGLARIPVMDDAHIPDLETLSYGGTFTEAQIPDLPTTKITEGTFGVARIPVLPTDRYGSAVLVDGSRPMAGTLNIGNHVIDNARRYMFGGGHEVSLRSMGTYDLYIESKDALHWSNVWMGDLAANRAAFYGTANMQGHPITGVATPTSGSHAANKSYVDAQGGGIGTHGNEYHDPNMLPTAGGTHTGTLWMSNGALKDMLYIRSPSGNALALSYGLASKLTIESDKVKIWDDLISAYNNQDKLGDSTHTWKEFHATDIHAYGTVDVHNHPIDDVKKIGFRDIHNTALITEGTYGVSVVSKDELYWGNIDSGWVYAHTGFAWYIEDKTAGENLTSAHLAYLKSDSKWWETDADTEATTKGLLGLIMQTKSTGQAVRVLVLGRVTFTGWGLTVGATQYVSCTKGLITETAPSGSGDQVRKIGHALSATTIIFNPDATILEIA